MKKAKHIIGAISRTILAATFLFSGFVKAVDPLGTVYKIEDYLKAFGGFFTDLLPLAGIAAVLLIMVEWLLGWMMICNIKTQWTSWFALAFYLVMTPLTLWIALTNPVSDCGCFGDALVLTNWQTFWKNVVLLTLVIVLLICRKDMPDFFKPWMEAGIMGIALIFGGAIMIHSYSALPPMDFRPYKIGNHIPTLMEIPDDAESDLYETTLIYEKDGVQKEFTLENYPKGDSTWHFVDQKSVLVKKGYVAPIHDFEIMTMDFEDITYDILESEKPVQLVVMYDLKKADRKQFGKVKDLIEQSFYDSEIGGAYILTGSGEEEVERVAQELQWDEAMMQKVFCYTDPVTLKTIVRANPGMIVVQNGTIIAKQNVKKLKIKN